MRKAVERRVRTRANGRCEYCRIPEAADAVPFHIDHVRARQHGGRTDPENLALCCSYCNAHKGPNLSGVDPVGGRVVPLFNPRRDRWEKHFRWAGPKLTGLTARGRATIAVLKINDPLNVRVRYSLMREGLYE